MRHGTSNRRQRSRNSNSGNGGRRSNQQRTQVYDSNGPDVRIRGTAHQVAEKYLSLAKDCISAGDSILAESYYQHAEHYIRIINEANGTFDLEKVTGRITGETIGNANKARADDENKEIPVKEDLSLPASILGDSVTVDTQEMETAE
ncbi:MAG: DUF4167 domain-containing protein [Alphaproteobacteria bacterium]|nr:DUF4167 domain-containing protein [Alphaproteobacteria bacterium]